MDKYVAAVDFIDLKDDEYLYRVGESYPRLGMKPTKKRLIELATKTNRMGYPLIVKAEDHE